MICCFTSLFNFSGDLSSGCLCGLHCLRTFWRGCSSTFEASQPLMAPLRQRAWLQRIANLVFTCSKRLTMLCHQICQVIEPQDTTRRPTRFVRLGRAWHRAWFKSVQHLPMLMGSSSSLDVCPYGQEHCRDVRRSGFASYTNNFNAQPSASRLCTGNSAFLDPVDGASRWCGRKCLQPSPFLRSQKAKAFSFLCCQACPLNNFLQR